MAHLGATTDEDLLQPAFRDRFTVRQDLEYYRQDDLAEIVRRAADRWSLEINRDAACKIASVSRGRPLGLGTLADRLGKTRGALQTVHEPYLIRCGLIVRTLAGRVLATDRTVRDRGT